MIKINMCSIPEASTEWYFTVLDNNESFTVDKITKPANQWTVKERPYIKSEISRGLIESFNAKREKVFTDYKKPINLRGRKVVKETNHAIIFDNNSVDTIQVPCSQDIIKIKAALNL